ncbi:hypothetical protein ABPG77_002577 [Micractinium sp. CCAP 211/92]
MQHHSRSCLGAGGSLPGCAASAILRRGQRLTLAAQLAAHSPSAGCTGSQAAAHLSINVLQTLLPRRVGPPAQQRGVRAAAAHTHQAATAAAATDAWIQATGVPLVEAFQQLTLQQAGLRSLALVLATALGVLVGNKLLDVMGTKMEAVAEKTRNSSGLSLLVGTALASVYRPAKMLLPVYGGFYSLLVVTALAEVAVSRMDDQHIHSMLYVCGERLLDVLKGLAQLMQDTSELVLIVFAAWFLIAWKDELIEVITANLEVDERDEINLTRVLVPLGNILSWAIVLGAGLTTMTAFGVNVQPLLAVGSIGTVAVGFAAQSTMQNVVSALQIYSTRPFIVGDRVQLKSLSGSTIATGVVEHIAPMRTVLRADNKLPIYISNKDVVNLLVVNESKLRRSSVAPKLPLIEGTITLRYCDVDIVPEVERTMTEYLELHPNVDPAISPRCVLAEFSPAGPQLSFRALLHKSAAGRQAFIRADMLRQAERIVRQHGGFLAVEQFYGGGLPPSPPPATGAIRSGSGEFGSTPAGA